jgi:hypothetical protein
LFLHKLVRFNHPINLRRLDGILFYLLFLGDTGKKWVRSRFFQSRATLSNPAREDDGIACNVHD